MMGRIPKIHISDILPLLEQGMKTSEIAKILNVHADSIRRHINSHLELSNAAKKIGEKVLAEKTSQQDLFTAEKVYHLLEKGFTREQIIKELQIDMLDFPRYISMLPERRAQFFSNYWEKMKQAALTYRKATRNVIPDAVSSEANIERIFELMKKGLTLSEVAERIGTTRRAISVIYNIVKLAGFEAEYGKIIYRSLHRDKTCADPTAKKNRKLKKQFKSVIEK